MCSTATPISRQWIKMEPGIGVSVCNSNCPKELTYLGQHPTFTRPFVPSIILSPSQFPSFSSPKCSYRSPSIYHCKQQRCVIMVLGAQVNICCSLVRVRAGVLVCVCMCVCVCVFVCVYLCVCAHECLCVTPAWNGALCVWCACLCVTCSLRYIVLLLHEMVTTVLRSLQSPLAVSTSLLLKFMNHSKSVHKHTITWLLNQGHRVHQCAHVCVCVCGFVCNM